MHVLKEGAHSMAKEIAYDNETREKLATGVAKLADAVRVTIGPKAVEEDVIEVKVRKTGEAYNFTRADYLEKVQELLKDL